jgi:hypothetical protein
MARRDFVVGDAPQPGVKRVVATPFEVLETSQSRDKDGSSGILGFLAVTKAAIAEPDDPVAIPQIVRFEGGRRRLRETYEGSIALAGHLGRAAQPLAETLLALLTNRIVA